MTGRPVAGPVASSPGSRSSRSGPASASKARTTLPPGFASNPRSRYFTPAVLRQLEQSLSERDRLILATLRQLRLATGDQLQRLHFDGLTERQRRRTLVTLEADRLIVRLARPIGGVRAGSAGSVFALDLAGQRLTSSGGPAHGRRNERPWTPGQLFTTHTLAITELYAQIAAATRSGRLELLRFQAEPHCWRRFQTAAGWTTLKPDAAVRLGAGAYEDHWFIEVDRGTESPSTIERKAAVYRAYWSTGLEQAELGAFPRVLWLVPDERRREVLVHALGRGPAETWRLHSVAHVADAIGRLQAGAGEAAS